MLLAATLLTLTSIACAGVAATSIRLDAIVSASGGLIGEPVTAIPTPPPPIDRRAGLGRALFESTLLSRDGKRSCGSCHDLETNGAEPRAVSISPSGAPLRFNAPTVFNAALSFRQNWRGDARTLEEQAEMSILDEGFMAETWDHLLAKLRADARMVARFKSAIGRPPDREGVLGALAAFEETLVTPDSRFDLWLRGDASALTAREVIGYRLFKTAGCVSCHQGVAFGGNLFETVGVYRPLYDRPAVRMRVPSLRNVAVTAPYFDDGSAATLEDAVRRMAEAQLGRRLGDDQLASLVSFLRTLTGRWNGRPLREAR